MPRKMLMSWEGAPNFRWVKMKDGVRYRVTCEELNAPLPTEEGSYKLANEWWQKKLVELSKPSPEEELKTRYERMDLQEAVEKGRAAEQLLRFMSRQVEAPKKDEFFATVLKEDGNFNLKGAARLVAKADGKPVEADKTTAKQVELFLKLTQSQVKPRSFREIKEFVGYLGNRLPALDKMGESTVSDTYAWLAEANLSPSTRKKRW